MFFGFFLAGIVSILLLKSLIEDQFIVTSVPCGLMLIYAASLWDFEEWQPRSGTAGDNLYYLGFLYTLTSLGHSLYRFNANATDSGVIITNFGIAIATTILGMALRILLGRRPVEDVAMLDESVRQDLADAARQLRAELGYTVNSFHEQLKEEQQQFLKHMQSLRRKTAQVEEGVAKAASGLIGRAQELEESAAGLATLQESVQQLDSTVKAAGQAIDGHSTALAIGSGDVCEALQAQAKEVRAVDFRQALDEHSSRLVTAAEAVRKSLQEQVERINGVDFRQAFINHGIKPISTELQSAAAEFSSLLKELRQADDARERALVDCEKATTSLHEAVTGQHAAATAVLDMASKLQDALESLNSVADRLAQSSDGAQGIARQISEVADGLSESAKRIRIVNEGLTGVRPPNTRGWPSWSWWRRDRSARRQRD